MSRLRPAWLALVVGSIRERRLDPRRGASTP